MSATHSRSGGSAANWRLTRSGATAPAPRRLRFLPWRRRWMPSIPATVIKPGHLLAVPRLALLVTVTDLGGQPAGPVGAAVLDPRVAQLVRGIGIVEIGVGHHGPAATDPVV